MKKVVCTVFLIMGVLFLAWGSVRVGWAAALLLIFVGALFLLILIRWIRRLFERLSQLLPVMVATPIIGLIVMLTYNLGRDHDLSPALFVAAALSFIVYGLCLSGPQHQSTG
jgi:hypothetical protein